MNDKMQSLLKVREMLEMLIRLGENPDSEEWRMIQGYLNYALDSQIASIHLACEYLATLKKDN